MSVLTPANQLTLTRVLLAPAFVILTVYGYFGWALIVFAVAGLTDLLDGLIARLAGEKTTLGAWLDPMADKLLLVTMFIVLTLPGIDSLRHSMSVRTSSTGSRSACRRSRSVPAVTKGAERP